ncbi:MAG: phosphodiesterase [Reyranella sp.]|uniref:phosphodiesterase n=1 Tax=Reyranella sp. TaxID=1929291 RepID=UPI001216B596|nr:phosphodiesterase [Reyranella sp.]TAJ85288.1 MAG: phosphodiesterase [Reyranella sp.]TBR30414.1 MAG: phosphodiesterase [Reyranella sp.]
MLIAHLSDPHVRPDGELYQGVVDSNAQFAAAIAHVNALDPRPDLVLLSGDLVDHGQADEYAMLTRLLASLDVPVLAIPGNHDEREAFRRAFAGHSWLPAQGPIDYAVGDRGPVRVVAVDVTLPGLHHGAMSEEGAAWLDRVLAAEPSRPTIVMMHQPPFDTGIPYMDPYSCREGQRLSAVLARHKQVERLLCGHVHRVMQLRFGGTTLCTAPSTTTTIALQLRPDARPASYIEPSAMLLHHWQEGTGLITHFVPIGTFPGPYPFA